MTWGTFMAAEEIGSIGKATAGDILIGISTQNLKSFDFIFSFLNESTEPIT